MELWIARDKGKSLNLYFLEPKKLEERGFFIPTYNGSYEGYISMNKKEFPQVTWENSPKKVKIELIKE